MMEATNINDLVPRENFKPKGALELFLASFLLLASQL